jgi:hypothetical protein
VIDVKQLAKEQYHVTVFRRSGQRATISSVSSQLLMYVTSYPTNFKNLWETQKLLVNRLVLQGSWQEKKPPLSSFATVMWGYTPYSFDDCIAEPLLHEHLINGGQDRWALWNGILKTKMVHSILSQAEQFMVKNIPAVWQETKSVDR